MIPSSSSTRSAVSWIAATCVVGEDILGTERIAQIAVVGLAGFLPRIGRPPGTPALAPQILSLNIDHRRQTGRAAEAAAKADPIRRFT